MNIRKVLFKLVIGSVLAAAACAASAQAVGRVLLAAGDAFATRDGREVRLVFNSPIEYRDVLRTGPAASLQVRFVDDSLVAIRENSQFAIEDYKFAGKEDGTERAIFRLVKGGFRAATGLIGRTRNASYAVHTPNATIGIRGTDYAVRDCLGDCGAGVKDGLYGTVLGQASGTNKVAITNNTGETVFGINEHFHVASINARPEPLLQPPTFVSFRPQGKAQATQQGGSGTGGEQSGQGSGAQGESRPQAVSGLLVPTVTSIGDTGIPFQQAESISAGGTSSVLPVGTVGFLGAGGEGGGTGGGLTFSNQLEGTTTAPFVITAFNNIFDAVNGDVTSGRIGSLPALETGCISATLPGCIQPPSTEPALTAFWGRWQDGSITDNGVLKPFNFVTGGSPGLHYAGGFDMTPYDVIATKTGTALFVAAFGTSPTNSLSQVGTGGPDSMTVTFGATPTALLNAWGMSFPGKVYSFPQLTMSIKPEEGGRVAGFEFKAVHGTCTGSCNPSNLLEIAGGFAGKTGQHAGMAIATENGGVKTGQVKLFQCVGASTNASAGGNC